MNHFIFDAQFPRVRFGAGALAQLPHEMTILGAKRVLVLCTPQQTGHAERVVSLLGPLVVATFDQAVMHVPLATVDAAYACAKDAQVDMTIAIGGGSTIGLAKALALSYDLPFLAIPTTYAGSEMTPIYGLTDQGIKRTGRDLKVLARTVVYDPMLSHGLPLQMTVVSGMNAIAHAIEGMYSTDSNPIISLMAEEGIRAISHAMVDLIQDPSHAEARELALYGAWLCGTVLGNSGMGLHHKLCHTLGGSFNLPHAELHSVMLPHALAYNAPAIPDVIERVTRALGGYPGNNAAIELFELGRRCSAPLSLREIGMKAEDLERATTLALEQRYPNPRPLEHDAIRQLLQRAFNGEAPQ